MNALRDFLHTIDQKEPDKNRAMDVASLLIKKYKVKEIPVNITEIARGEGINSISTTNDMCKYKIDGGITGGFLFAKKNDCSIFINDSLDEKDKLYVIAHELGHFMLHRNTFMESPDIKPYVIDTKTKGNKFDVFTEEVEADVFARSILLPDSFFINYMLKDNISIYTMSDLFQVPIQAVREKLRPSI